MHRAANEASIEAIDEESRTVTLSFVSEQAVNRWFGSEVLQVDEKSMVLDRIKNGLGCLLFNHDRNKVLGKVVKAWVEDQRGYAKVQFDEGEEEDKIFGKVKSKTLQGVSVGYNPLVWEKVQPGQKSTSGRVRGPAYVAVRWEPLEISITPTPADDSVGVGRSIEEEEEMDEENKEGTQEERQAPPSMPPSASPTDNADEAAARAASEERTRCVEIMSLCREFNEDPTAFLSDSKKTANDVRAVILNKLKEQNKPSPTTRSVLFGENEQDKFTRAAVDGLILRGGISIEKPAEGAQQLRNLSLKELFVETLERGGVEKARYMDESDLLKEASRMESGALPGILSNVVNKTVSDTYKTVPATFELWTREGSVNDYKEVKTYTLSEAGALEELKEMGEFKNDVIKESETARKVLDYGRKWSLTKKAIVNDDLGALITLPRKYAMAARRGINKLVYKALAGTSGTFTQDHKNLAAAGSLPSVKSLGEARSAMRKHKNLKGEEALNIVPKFIIIPSDLETLTEQLLYSATDPAYANANVKNPFANKLEIVCEAELNDLVGVTPAWFLAAHPAFADTIQVDYLKGRKEPKIDMRESFNILGFEWRIHIAYGVTVLDYKGLYKNPGKAIE